MRKDIKRRPPTDGDVAMLAKALSDNGVEYVIIGGAAMALHGFPRMTRDIDLFLPVDAANNARLLKALQAVPNGKAALSQLNREYMDQGYSTSFEGEIVIDILYVAADQTFDNLRPHVKRIDVDGVPVWTLDVDGMLISKKTTRESDVPDRIKLERLRNALFDVERQRRLDALAGLRDDSSAPVRYFAQMAEAAVRAGKEAAPDWKALEEQVLVTGSKQPALDVRDLAEVLSQHSPGAINPSRQAAIRQRSAALAERGNALRRPRAGSGSG